MMTVDHYHKIRIQELSAALVINKFIQGIEPYKYEDYLLEFVNSSTFFLAKSKQQPYLHPVSEANGEWDCTSPTYQIDFKLAAAESMLRAKRLFSKQITYLNGITLVSAPLKKSSDPDYKPIQATCIFAALRGLVLPELLAIQNRSSCTDQIERDICHLMKTMQCDKNLMVFFPYNFYFDEPLDKAQARHFLIEALNQDFRQMLSYRSQVCPQRDTYFSFLYARKWIVLEWKNAKLVPVDAVSIRKSPIFMRLLDLSEDVFSGDVLK